MIRKFLAVCSTLGLSSVLLAGDYPSVSDYLAWPSDTPNGLTKFVGGNVTPDDFDDAFALHGTSLYLVHAPAMFARWELLASGVTDFVVVPRGVNGIDGALFSDSSGLRLAKWQSGAASVAPIAGTSAWANAGQLCAVDDGFGGTSVAAVAAGNRVRRGKWAANGAWSNGVTTTETSAITSLALANYSPTAGTEQACVAGNTLRIRTETGTLLANTGVVNTVAHKVFRIADGGHALDSFLYVAASTLGAPYQEVLQEVFYDGASLTIETGIWLVRNAVTNHPWAKGERCVTIQAANYGEIFRF
ncbi:MAG: hypothetical protein K8S98_07340, partial [Planctomycetes bacterium]|nr:hypothetical protein [Planctomycetota bacterium]